MNVKTPRDWPLIGRRIGFILGFGVVAGIAAWASYWHQVDLALLAHQPAKLANVLPLSVDGMLVVGAMAMADDIANNRKPRGWARFAFWLGATVSTLANITSTAVHYGDLLSIVVSAWAPICFLVSVEIIRRKGKPQPVTAVEPTPEVRVTPEPVVQAAEVVAAEVTRLPVPVSPAPQQQPVERRLTGRTGPLVTGPSRRSPLTGRVLMEEPPKV